MDADGYLDAIKEILAACAQCGGRRRLGGTCNGMNGPPPTAPEETGGGHAHHLGKKKIRDLPRDGGPAAVWVVRREGDQPEAPLRLLCGWTTSGNPAPLPLGLVLQPCRPAAAGRATRREPGGTAVRR